MDRIKQIKEYNKSGAGKYITIGYLVVIMIIQLVFCILMAMFAFNNPDVNLRKE